jgi:hypothetical protein
MTQTIKANLDDALAKRFKKMAMETHDYKKGAMKKTLEELIKKALLSGEVDWASLKGVLKSKSSSVELQHSAWLKLSDTNRYKRRT